MERKQFTFYRSFYESIENLQTNKEKLQAYQMICGYALKQKVPNLEEKKPCAAMVFKIAQPVLDAAHKRAESTRKLNDAKGW